MEGKCVQLSVSIYESGPSDEQANTEGNGADVIVAAVDTGPHLAHEAELARGIHFRLGHGSRRRWTRRRGKVDAASVLL